jgi:hypothetical protein
MRQGRLDVENKYILLKDLKIDPLAGELTSSEEAQPYVHYLMKVLSNDATGAEGALQVLRDLPLEKRYTRRVLEWTPILRQPVKP